MNEIVINLPAIADGEDKVSPFKNRIRKNYRHIRKWARRTQTNCFRIYDRDIHHYPLAIDFYDGRFCIYYFSPSCKQDEPPTELVQEVADVLHSIFQVDPAFVYWKTRARHKETRQYEKLDELKEFFTVFEYGVKFKVNLVDYLDTGLFLDHRETRRVVSSISNSKKLLNLFAYTCSFSVHAAIAGAVLTKSVDMSNTYTSWGKDNFILNSLPLKNNVIIRADCLTFLDEEIRSKMKYDLIVIDPPTISRSKKMKDLFDVQEDYIFLISKALKLLLPGGVIFFSTNSRRFVFDQNIFEGCSIIDISQRTIPLDFHDSKIHRCWKISI